jgi:hypothetical protein
MSGIKDVVDALNRHAGDYRFGRIQAIRKSRSASGRVRSKLPFASYSTFEDYAFHSGGRHELQFNVGMDVRNRLRWGVAFSLQLNQALPSIDPMLPKIDRFNEFMRLYSEDLAVFRLWHFDGGVRSDERYPQPISGSLIRPGVFIFLGALGDPQEFEPHSVLSDLDRLMPVYEYVEGAPGEFPDLTDGGFKFTPGHTHRASRTTSSTSPSIIEVSLRHNEIEDELVEALRAEFGPQCVGSEHPTGTGGVADVLVSRGAVFDIYEIKIGSTARSCIRQAVGQLFDYGYWPGSVPLGQLVVVGEPPLDDEALEFLDRLQTGHRLPVSYRQVVVSRSAVGRHDA